MCCRVAIPEKPPKRITRIINPDDWVQPSLFNVAPSMSLPVVWQADDNFIVRPMTWGLVPHWSPSRKPEIRPANARIETAAHKPYFRSAWRTRRCVIPISGFYEWRHVKAAKQPYYFTAADGGGLVLAGLWEDWHKGNEQPLQTCTILVGSPNDLVAKIHNRMPVILNEELILPWLSLETPLAELSDLCRPLESSEFTAWPVSPTVNNARNQGAVLIEPIGPELRVGDGV